MNLFQHGEFTGNSGVSLPFKIDCDALSDGDIDCLARIIGGWYKGWALGEVVGVPRGGLRLAEAVKRYVKADGHNGWRPNLIVDDVLTTGESMKRLWSERYPNRYSSVYGAVIFARGPCPEWVRPILTLDGAGRCASRG